MSRLFALLPLLLACTSVPATASTVYKCRARDGRVSYQDAPCTKAQQQQILQFSGTTAAPSPTARTDTMPTTPDTGSDAPAPSAAPATSLPQLYRCVHAVDGSAYISRHGHPRPFLAPLGMLGALSTPLAQVYGQPGGAGISAPEVNRDRVTSGLVANNFVRVQDRCRPLSVPEICHALRDEYEKNAHQLQNAFQSDAPPLRRRDARLRAQLSNCRRANRG